MFMHHYVYCVENLINHKVYIGKHSTTNLDDGYMGSGKLLGKAIAKYGLENFRKTILCIFNTCEEALACERSLVTEEFVRDPNTYNLTTGGGDGWWAINSNIEFRREKNRRAALAMNKVTQIDPEFCKRRSQRVSEQCKRLHAVGVLKRPDWTGRRHRQNSKDKIGAANAIHQRGEGNSQFGTVWVSHEILRESRRIKKDELADYLELGWIQGRKMKW